MKYIEAKDFSKFDEINRLASEALYDNISETRKQNIWLKVYNKILGYVNSGKLQKYDCLRGDKNVQDNISDDDVISLSSLNDAFSQAKNNCQKAFVATGERREFAKELFSLLKLSNTKHIADRLGEENDYRVKKVYELTKRLIQKYNIDKQPLKYMVGKKKLIKFCQELGVPDEEFLDDVDEIYDNYHVSTSSFSLESGDDDKAVYATVNVPSKDFSDSCFADEAMYRLLLLISKVFEREDVSKTNAKYMKYFITLQYKKSGLKYDNDFKPYIDEQLWIYCDGKDLDNEVSVLAKYLDKQYDTVRKNLNVARANLLKVVSKGVR